MNNNNNEIDILAILSVVLGIINVQENRLQSAQNDVQTANDKQAKYLLEEITRKFDEQNKILVEQNVMLSEIKELLNKSEKEIKSVQQKTMQDQYLEEIKRCVCNTKFGEGKKYDS